MSRLTSLIGLLLLVFSVYSCHVDEARQQDRSVYSYAAPVLLNDGIDVNSADVQSVDSAKLTDLVNALRQDEIQGVDSLLIAINNELVLEEYFAGWGRDDIHDLRSATKSITSLLAGIAIDQQLLSLDTAVYPFFAADYPATDNWTPEKNEILLQDFMNMSSGLACNDNDANSPGQEGNMYRHSDWVKFILDLPMTGKRSRWFAYCTGGVQVVARMIENASSQSLSEFAQTNLFEPLAIRNFQWSVTGTGRTEGSGHIYMRSRDMLKLGLLVLNKGQWNGQQLISEQWINELYNPHYPFYGYFWWHQSFESDTGLFPKTDAFYASGNGGQEIWVVPDLQLVMVFTANNYNRPTVSEEIIQNYILPAVYQQ